MEAKDSFYLCKLKSNKIEGKGGVVQEVIGGSEERAQCIISNKVKEYC